MLEFSFQVLHSFLHKNLAFFLHDSCLYKAQIHAGMSSVGTLACVLSWKYKARASPTQEQHEVQGGNCLSCFMGTSKLSLENIHEHHQVWISNNLKH